MDSLDPPADPKCPPLTSSLSVQTRPSVHSSAVLYNDMSSEVQSQQGDPHSPLSAALDCRRLSPVVGIPGRAESPLAEAFLVPSSCHSICQHYSDLHIAGGQVLPLSPSAGDPQGSYLQDYNPVKNAHPGPFLLSGDIPPPSLPPPVLYPKRRNSSRCWREGSGRERPSLLQDGRPLSNSQLNSYLEQKLLELYKEYLTEGPAGPHRQPFMASELLQSSLEQITLQLSREQRLEATRAKDMLLSFLMRATSSPQSSQISTPLLQISSQTK